MGRAPHEGYQKRMRAYDYLLQLKETGNPKELSIERVAAKFHVPKTNVSSWFEEKHKPRGRKGTITMCPSLWYVLGALLGDGCTYQYHETDNHLILVGDEAFTRKFAAHANACTSSKAKNYPIRSKNIWFVRVNNFELFNIFSKLRMGPVSVEKLIEDRSSALQFIEGFFDAEGCVKIINDKARKTPKICLDITNTNFEWIDLSRRLLHRYLNIEAKYSLQKPGIGSDGHFRKAAYHLRIYKKECVRLFFSEICTSKLTASKRKLLVKWINNGL